ncbi:MAG TPA: O-antigen ligase family protein [Bryobacteraceae bacterium]|nr:O-antigen ligase family protein [Bryobacteraceae bacterium]
MLLCFYYMAFGILTVVNVDTAPLLGGLKVYRFVYPLLCFLFVLRLFTDPFFFQQIRRWPNLNYLAILFVLAASSLYSTNARALAPTEPTGLLSILVVTLLFWLSAGQIRLPSDFEIFAKASIALSTCLSLWVVWTAAQGNFSVFRGGTGVNENYESLLMLTGAIAAFYFLVATDGLAGKLAFAGALSVILLGSGILASRGSLISAAVGSLITGFGVFARVPRRQLIVPGIFLVVLLSVLAFSPAATSVVSAFQGVEVSTLDDRTVIWQFAWRHFNGLEGLRVLFGEGLASSATALDTFMPQYANYHNDYLMWVMEHGLVGLSVFSLFLYRIGRIATATSHPQKALIQGWFAFLLIAGLSATVSSSEHLYWILLGVIVGAGCLEYSAAADSIHASLCSVSPYQNVLIARDGHHE